MKQKSTWIFLALMFAFSFLGFPALVYLGVLRFTDRGFLHNAAFIATMYIPALAVWLARLISGEDAASLNVKVWPLPWRKAALWAVAIPVVFFLTGVIAWTFGKTAPQWGLGELVALMDKRATTPLPPAVHDALPALLLVFGPLASALAGMTAYALIALGGEIAWRAFLLPKALPLGRYPAYLVTGLLWGAWFSPLVWAQHHASGATEAFWPMLVCCMGMAVAGAFILGETWRRTEHTGLCAVVLGSFAGQVSGIWSYLFAQDSPPYTGPFGVVSLVTWGLIASILAAPAKRKPA